MEEVWGQNLVREPVCHSLLMKVGEWSYLSLQRFPSIYLSFLFPCKFWWDVCLHHKHFLLSGVPFLHGLNVLILLVLQKMEVVSVPVVVAIILPEAVGLY